MRRITSLVILLLGILPFFFGAAAQSRLAEDNKQLEALTRPFATYALRLVVNDSLSHNQVTEIHKELRKHFAFLRPKKYKKNGADFEVQVSVRGKIDGSLQYATAFKSNTQNANRYYAHTYLLNHVSSADVSLFRKGRELARILIDSNALIERRYSFTEVKGDYSWMKDPTLASLQGVKDVQSAMNHHSRAQEVWSFEQDFIELLKRYISR